MFDVIIVANGKSARCKTDKLSFNIGQSSVISRTVNAFSGISGIANIILVTDSEYEFPNVIKVCGGKTRTESVRCGLEKVKSKYVLIHDGARPFVSKNLIETVMSDTEKYGSSIPFLPITDSLRHIENDVPVFVNRSDYITIQTPQGFLTEEISFAYNTSSETDLYDDSQLYSLYVRSPHLTNGERFNKKITTPDDLYGYNLRVGSGFDVHPFANNGKPLVLGGVQIPFDKGLSAHSDGDVVIHAVIDALLSGANQRDIGVLVPDSDPIYKNANSANLLLKVSDILQNENVFINNITVTIIAQTPKLSPYIPLMQKRMAEVLKISDRQINISATTTENLGIVGEKKAIAVLAIASLY